MKKTKRLRNKLTLQVLLAIILGVITGLLFPSFAPTAKLISGLFINLINMLIAPLVFFTIVLGIAHMGDMRRVGRVGGKALLYFEVVTTFALVIGMVVSNVVKPGVGFAKTASVETPLIQNPAGGEGLHWGDFITHLVPRNIVEAFAKGEILPILLFALLFGAAVGRMGEGGRQLLVTFDRLSNALFGMLQLIMKLAPLGAFGGMAYTIGQFGWTTLLPMGKVLLTVYITCALFIFGVLNVLARYFGFSLWQYLRYIRSEILVVLGTSSSESVLPAMMEKMERLGCSRPVVGLVLPTGYSFNLDGTSIYLSIAFIFLLQAFGVQLTLGQQLTALGVLMITSKGAAGVTGSGFIVLSSTLAALKVIPVTHVAILLGVDRFMSEARSITNLIGNGLATLIISKSEGEFNEEAYRQEIQSGTNQIFSSSGENGEVMEEQESEAEIIIPQPVVHIKQ